ncbi:MAG: outer membrane protein transport protein, partial [Saprospiraceae bacterium]|nr:outer membrane protein transport protein [Saprospiraceae bacterium]
MPLSSKIQRLVFVVSLFSISSYAAETLSVVPDTAQALGIVGGRLANLRDASVVRVNPANMLELERTELLIGSAAWNGDISFDSSSGASVRVDNPWVFPASLYLVVPITPGRLAVGIGISTPFGLATSYPKDMDPRLRYSIPYESRLLAVNITPAIAFRVTDTITFAAGLDIIYSELHIKQIYPWQAAVPGAAAGEIGLHGKAWGLGAYMGLNWKLAEGHRLSLVGRLPVTLNYRGEYRASGMPAALKAGGFTDTSSFKSDMTYPGSIAVGYGVDLTDRLTLGFDFQWTANSSHDDLPLNVGNNQALLGSSGINFGWKNSIDLGTGISYKMTENWTLRGGYLFSENSVSA